MASVFKRGQRGFQAAKEEKARRDAAFEAKRGKLFRFYLKDGEADVPGRFLTEEPILFYEHRMREAGRTVEYLCKGENCPLCEDGHKPSYAGAWLFVDGREFETDERKNGQKTGKRIKVKNRLKLYVRGMTDIAKLDRLSQKYGLTSRPWFITKTGSGQSTSYELDRGDEDRLTSKQIEALIEQLPEKYRKLYNPKAKKDEHGVNESLYDIVNAQIFGFEDDEDQDDSHAGDEDDYTDTGEDEDDINERVMSVEDEDEDDAPKSSRKPVFKKPGAAKSSAKPAVKKPSISAKKPAAKASKSAAKPGIKRPSIKR